MIATILSDDHEVIDTDAARIGAFTNSLDVVTIEGDGVSLSTLRQAEIEAADLFIANTDNDETNIIASADEDECEQFEETVEKKVNRRDEAATVVTIDQTRKAVGADLYAACYPVGVNLLGTVTEHGETTVLECGGSSTGEVTIRFLEHLQAEFGETLVVLLDQATYFTAAVVKHFAADEPIELVYFPTGLPDLNPTEEYWRRLKLALGNRYFGSCTEIRSAVWTALELISLPGVYQYLCP